VGLERGVGKDYFLGHEMHNARQETFGLVRLSFDNSRNLDPYNITEKSPEAHSRDVAAATAIRREVEAAVEKSQTKDPRTIGKLRAELVRRHGYHSETGFTVFDHQEPGAQQESHAKDLIAVKQEMTADIVFYDKERVQIQRVTKDLEIRPGEQLAVPESAKPLIRDHIEKYLGREKANLITGLTTGVDPKGLDRPAEQALAEGKQSLQAGAERTGDTLVVKADPTAQKEQPAIDYYGLTFFSSNKLELSKGKATIPEGQGIRGSLNSFELPNNVRVYETKVQFEQPLPHAVLDPQGLLPGTDVQQSREDHNAIATQMSNLQQKLGPVKLSEKQLGAWYVAELESRGYEATVIKSKKGAQTFTNVHVFGKNTQIETQTLIEQDRLPRKDAERIAVHPQREDLKPLIEAQHSDYLQEKTNSIPNPNPKLAQSPEYELA
jgi:hypothetical protein